MKTITNIIYPAFALVMLACFVLSPTAYATCQQGCLKDGNTVLGDDALINNSEVGSFQTALGFQALFSNTQGFSNTATGYQALFNNTLGWNNTAIGVRALYSNIGGFSNTAIGGDAMNSSTGGFFNTAVGVGALTENTAGNDNTAMGYYPLWQNTTGRLNVAIGTFALSGNTTGKNNTAIGVSAARSANGNNNIALGYQAGGNLTTGGNNIDIGNQGVAGEANTIRIGTVGVQNTTFVAGISGATVPTGVAVIVDTDGHLGTITSSVRFKDDIKPMDNASKVILALKPVTFRYKHDLDPAGITQFGLVAEDVEKVNPDLVARDDQGKPYTVRYDQVNAMLLNEFLKEHREIQELKKQVAALTAGLQKVSAQLELSKSAPQTVVNNQ
jgi:Chaperone of endosialidase